MLKNNKGISLITMVMAVLLLLILLSTLTFSATNSLSIRRLNKLYNDIRALNDAVAVYYLEHDGLPVSKEFASVKVGDVMPEELKGVTVKAENFSKSKSTFNGKADLINPNDYDDMGDTGKIVYYLVDLNLLDITLENANGTYIVNEQSHTVYYVNGATVDGTKYHTLPITYKEIEYNTRPEVTSIVANKVYIPTGGTTINLKDYLVFYSGTKTNGVPRTLTYTSLTGANVDNYLSLDNGMLTSKTIEPVSTEFSTTVTATNYGSSGTIGPTTIKISLTDLRVKDGTTEVSEIDLLKSTTKELTVDKLGAAGVLTLLSNVVSGDGISAIVSDSTKKVTIVASNVGETDLAVIENNGRASKNIRVNVYDPKLDKETVNIESVNFTDTLTLNIEDMFKVSEEDNNLVEWTSSNTDILKVEKDSTSDLKARLVPSSSGNVTVSCKIIIKGKELTTLTVPVNVKSFADSEADANVQFSTAYGRVDVIWLDTNNNVIDKPNSPDLTSGTESMTPVYWDNSLNLQRTTKDDSKWYSYNVGTGTADNLTSHWANAETQNGSLFVWIPRFAYRITYYEGYTEDESGNYVPTGIPTGYYDGYGMWRAEDLKLKLKLENGIQIVDNNGEKYIVHPAFETNLDLGGWSKDLSGFWFAKYEMSGSTADTLKSIDSVQSIRGQTVGVQYTNARQATFGFIGTDSSGQISFMNSHMVKNSEWGAVAFLTHSKYGRNGHEIKVNNNTSSYTGGGSNGDYKTNTGQSTTGNVYGIYDMRGNSWEHTAGFNEYDNNDNLTKYGWTIDGGLQKKTDTIEGTQSTKYATKYSNSGSTGSENGWDYGITGDAIKEIYAYMDKVIPRGWFSDYAEVVNAKNPFSDRGGGSSYGTTTGTFGSSKNGGYVTYDSFRVSLCP